MTCGCAFLPLLYYVIIVVDKCWNLLYCSQTAFLARAAARAPTTGAVFTSF